MVLPVLNLLGVDENASFIIRKSRSGRKGWFMLVARSQTDEKHLKLVINVKLFCVNSSHTENSNSWNSSQSGMIRNARFLATKLSTTQHADMCFVLILLHVASSGWSDQALWNSSVPRNSVSWRSCKQRLSLGPLASLCPTESFLGLTLRIHCESFWNP